MNIKYHIPTPKFDPSQSEQQWVLDNIAPQLYPALSIIKGAFDRVDIPQSEFDNWPQRKAVEAHFAELGLTVRRFAGFISNKNFNPIIPHIDAFIRGEPMVARFNIVYQGQSPVTLNWWDEGVGDRIEERSHTELRNGEERTAYSYKANTTDWPLPSYSVNNPGAGWNRTNVAHRADGVGCDVNRIIITAEIAKQVQWEDLVGKLASLGYC